MGGVHFLMVVLFCVLSLSFARAEQLPVGDRSPAKEEACGCLDRHPCGVACLRYALARFRIRLPEESLQKLNQRGSVGLDEIQEACKEAGLSARRESMDLAELERLLGTAPSICAVFGFRNGHFGFVEEARPGEMKFITLTGDANWCSTSRIAPIYDGSVLLLSGRPQQGVATEPSPSVGNDSQGVGSSAASPLRVVYFHSPSCHECQRVKAFLPQVLSRWGNRVSLEPQSVDDIRVFDQLLKYEKHYGATVSAPPAIFIGDKALVDEEAIVAGLQAAIERAIAYGIATFRPESADRSVAVEPGDIPGNLISRFQSFGPGAVAIAGLIDGVNPCAFTTIVFFLSMLAYLKKTRREILAVGAGFTAGMFGAYFLLGVGLLGAVKAFSVSYGLSSGLACLVAVLAFVLAGWSLIDAVRCMQTGDVRQASLGLPQKVKQRIHAIIREGLSTRSLVIGSVSVGFLVSLLESLCTGQVYLPTIVFMTRSPDMRAAAVSYLLLYNAMFIMPLVAIILMAYWGVRSEALGSFFRRRLAVAKFAMAALFAALGIMVLSTI